MAAVRRLWIGGVLVAALLGGSKFQAQAYDHLLIALESARELGMTALARRSERLIADASVSGVT